MSASFQLFPPVSTQYKKFSDYKNITPLANSHLKFGHAQFIAVEKQSSRSNNPMYGDHWYLLMREGLFRAQIEKAMSEIYAYFLERSTDIDIIQEGQDFYVASREIANFITWDNVWFSDSFKIKENGTLIFEKDNIEKQIIDLGKLDELSRFFRDRDITTSGNFGIQETNSYYQAFKIDNEKALDFTEKSRLESQSDSDNEENSDRKEVSTIDNLTNSLQRTSNIKFKKDFTQELWYQNERYEMRKKIATTDFSIVENIIRKNITSNQKESVRWLMNHMHKYSQDENFKSDLTERLLIIDQTNYSFPDAKSIIENLKKAHEELRSEFSVQFKMN